MNKNHQRCACLALLLIALSTIPTPVAAEPLREAAPEDLFAVRLVTPPDELIEDQLPLLFQVFGPYDGKPLAGVPMEVSITLEGDGTEERSRHQLVSDASGEADLLVELAATRRAALEVDIEATARRRGLSMQLNKTVYPASRPYALVSTDRSLYQPGQTLHARGLWLDSFGRPSARETVSWKIDDAKGRTMTVVEGRTSEMGIASFDWTIPSHAESGDYSIDITPNPNYDSVFFRVRAYETATLLIEVEPEKPVVLPGEEASVTVIARLPNGDPMVGAMVEIFADPLHRSSWEAADEPLGGDSRPVTDIASTADRLPLVRTDTQGRAVLSLALDDAFDELSEDNGMKDLPLRVRVTDPLGQRSESLAFTQRLSTYPIHLYGVGLRPHRDNPSAVPANLFVFSQRANGEPVSTWVEVQRRLSAGHLRSLGKVQTSSLGVADLGHLPIGPQDDIVLLATAGPDDDAALLGRSEPYWRRAADLDMLIPRPLRRSTEAVELTVRGMRPASRVRLDVYRQQTLVAQQLVPYTGPTAEVRIPYRESFRGPLNIVAQDLDPHRHYHGEATDIKVVSYPLADQAPHLTLHSDQPEYRPGDTAQLTLQHDAGNVGAPPRPYEGSAVAVAIVDAASHARQVSDDLGNEASLLRHLWILERWEDPESLAQGGWTLAELRALPADQRFGDEAQMVARGLLADTYINEPLHTVSNPLDAPRRHLKAFFEQMDVQLHPILARLRRAAPEAVDDVGTFVAALRHRGVSWETLRDPWNEPFRIESDIFYDQRRFNIFSNGWDRTPGTADDFVAWSVQWPYAIHLGMAITAVVGDAFNDDQRLLVSEDQVIAALASRGITWSEERDPWGQPFFIAWDDYSDGYGGALSVKLMSRGPDGLRDVDERTTDDPGHGDDSLAWRSYLPWSVTYQGALQLALQRAPKQAIDLSDGPTLRQGLAAQGVDTTTWKDPWGHPVYFKLSQSTDFVDDWRLDAEGRSTPEPVRRTFDVIHLWSAGPDGQAGTSDDTKVGRVRHPRGESEPFFSPIGDGPASHSPASHSPASHSPPGDIDPEHGLLTGRVLTEEGFAVPGSLVTVLRSVESKTWTTHTDTTGQFSFALPEGDYRVKAELEGFTSIVFPEVPVRSQTRTRLRLTLSLHWQTETVMVTAESPVAESGIEEPPTAKAPRPSSTPRLRKDFPETLFWMAEGHTDADGRLQLDVPLADSITTWQVAALASDTRGRVSAAEHTLVVDQPFFLQPDLPPLLTVGDTIALPVQVHNKTGHTLDTELRLRVESSGRAETDNTETGKATDRYSSLSRTLPKGASQFSLWQPFETPGEATVRWTAEARPTPGTAFEDGAGPTGDAVQKTIQVTPHGSPRVSVQSRLLRHGATTSLAAPQDALPIDAMGSVGELEIVIYEGLDDHLLGALDGLESQPTGCAEQITASAWLHLLRLEHLTAQGQQNSAVAKESRAFLTSAYQLLWSYRRDEGFAYWPRSGDVDLALSAMILEFLLALEDHLEVDQELIAKTVAFLTASQQASGAWPSSALGKSTAAVEGNAMLQLMDLRRDALLSHGLAAHAAAKDAAISRHAARRALQRLHAEVGEDPYALAWMVLTATSLDEPDSADSARQTVRRLQALATPSDGDLFWQLRANTPFHGWGDAGRFETTALAVEALATGQHLWRPGSREAETLKQQLNGGLTFLLLNKGGDGTWASTQASLRVLRSLAATIPDDPGGPVIPVAAIPDAVIPDAAIPLFDDAPLPAVAVGDKGPQRWTLPLGPGQHTLTWPGRASRRWTLVQTRLHHFRPWETAGRSSTSPSAERDLHFTVQCPTGPLQIGEPTSCQVEIQRLRHRGLGMMIAEIGLPPGAEIDTQALRQAMRDHGLQHFEVWPGRLVLYVWPRAEGLQLSIPWRPRLALRAKARPSILYDYYNPESRVVLAPTSFEVRPEAGGEERAALR